MLPNSFNDIVFTNIGEKRYLKRIVGGDIAFPSHAKSGVLLHGKYGAGKTTFAHLLAAILEYEAANEAEKTCNDWAYKYRSEVTSITPQNIGKPIIQPANFELVDCGEIHSNSIKTFIQRISMFMKMDTSGLFQAATFNHFVFDELDNWSDGAQANLKGLMSHSPLCNVFYITTNNLHKIDKGIIDRSICVEMNGGDGQEYLMALRNHFTHLSNYSDQQLLDVIRAASGSWRNMEDAAYRM